ncbi:sensor histidine kinase [Kordiimonas laminariae]|uniref:sensor histidine kinase n=1 Tax=Kordiimonas laminariae TaxID=2917717 RepID=UPI001FF6240A|nr:HAMP domain-containing sensor histidine kinase [Kordiimonas laminariae]MCK0068412.1 HAMP domain-containing histidine kinase [Kordiimonas laminariae]
MSYMPDTVQSFGSNLEINPTIKALLEGLANVSGITYLKAVSKSICDALGADIALVGQLSEDRQSMQTIAMYRFGEHVDDLQYGLRGTPCAETVTSDYCIYRKGVQHEFPDDQDLVDDAIEGYIGYPLIDENGKTIGAIIALSQQPIEVDSLIMDFARIAAARTRAELQHYILQKKLQDTLSDSLILNYTKSMFMANISHEMHNPLASMIGYAALIRDGQVDPKEVRDFANSICTIGETLQALVSDIISLSSLELWGNSIAKETFDLTDTAIAGKRMQMQQAASKNLKILPIKQTEPIYVVGDITLTKKALLNVLINAVKYTENGEIEISISKTEDGAEIAITDTGIGMSVEKISAITKPMKDIGSTYEFHQNGAGLGVPLSIMMMEKQGGQLSIESAEGKGTTVRLHFPKELLSDKEGDFI